ncbi:hypothetical protein LINPERHAP1_LOCUS18708 [Linum perenne]
MMVHLLGKTIGYSYMCHRLQALWKLLGNLHIIDLDKNCFMVKFASDQDYFKALTGGPWMILDHYLIVHQWDSSFRISNDMLKKMVAWVRFRLLPIHFYHAQVLTSLGNLVRKTIKIDFNTQSAKRGKFAWIVIELDLNEPLPLVVMLDGQPQPVEYESLPNLCFECGRIGHLSINCPKNPLAVLPPPSDPQGVLTVVKGPGLVAPVVDQFGPWMLVSRRHKLPKRESQ